MAVKYAAKPIDEVEVGETVVLDDGRQAVVRYSYGYVTRIGPSATMLMHLLVTETADGSTEYVDAAWRDLVTVVVD